MLEALAVAKQNMQLYANPAPVCMCMQTSRGSKAQCMLEALAVPKQNMQYSMQLQHLYAYVYANLPRLRGPMYA